MEQLTYERLQENLTKLKMTRSAEILDTVLLHAEQEKASYLAFLDDLLEEEVSAKEGRRIVTAMRPLKNIISPFTRTLIKKPSWNSLILPSLQRRRILFFSDLPE
jgi:DNA replication protein DnaC